jgi:adenosine deaminase CECR1
VALSYGFSITSDDGTKQLEHRRILQLLSDTLKEELPKIQAKGHAFVGIRVIYAIMRLATREAMAWCIENCIQMKQEFPELICGEPLELIIPVTGI